MWRQYNIIIPSKSRGFHLITNDILKVCVDIKDIKIGLLNLLIKHTSASICLNENADPTVRKDFEKYFKKTILDGSSYFEHTLEGDDDMTAHLKSSIIGACLTIPIRDGRLQLGIWQGIYLGEHRISGGSRTIVGTLTGEMK